MKHLTGKPLIFLYSLRYRFGRKAPDFLWSFWLFFFSDLISTALPFNRLFFSFDFPGYTQCKLFWLSPELCFLNFPPHTLSSPILSYIFGALVLTWQLVSDYPATSHTYHLARINQAYLNNSSANFISLIHKLLAVLSPQHFHAKKFA